MAHAWHMGLVHRQKQRFEVAVFVETWQRWMIHAWPKRRNEARGSLRLTQPLPHSALELLRIYGARTRTRQQQSVRRDNLRRQLVQRRVSMERSLLRLLAFRESRGIDHNDAESLA